MAFAASDIVPARPIAHNISWVVVVCVCAKADWGAALIPGNVDAGSVPYAGVLHSSGGMVDA